MTTPREPAEPAAKAAGTPSSARLKNGLEAVAFSRYFDLSRYSLEEAVTRFGNLLIGLTEAWR